jgi:hypothetical protein
MMKSGDTFTLEREGALADGLVHVAAELRLVDPQDYVAFVRLELFGNIANIVNSSTELYYQPGTLKFGMSGEADISWGEPTRVILDMEFDYQGVKAYFRLLLDAEGAAVELTYLSFEGASSDPESNTQRLRDAIAAARLPDIRYRARLAELMTAHAEAAVEAAAAF